MSTQRTLACRACNSSKINTRMDGTYRCQDCGDVDEPIERVPKARIQNIDWRRGGATRVYSASHSPVFHTDEDCAELNGAPNTRQYPLGWVVTHEHHPNKPCSRCTLGVEQTVHVAVEYDDVDRSEIADSFGSKVRHAGGVDQ